MGNYNDVFPSKYLKASDLNGQARNAVIERIEKEKMQTGEVKYVAYFRNGSKGMVLNKTNCKAIAHIAMSDETADWIGQLVQVFVADVEFQGEMVAALRIRQPQKQRTVAAPKPMPELEPEAEPAPDFGDVASDSDVPF